MKFPPYEFKEGLQKGLRETCFNPRNSQRLVTSQGMFPEDGVLRYPPEHSQIDTSTITCSFPYPQVLVLSNFTLACTSTSIYELVGSTWILKLGSLTAGFLWSCVDFGTYLILNNGAQVVTRSPETGVYTAVTDNSIPKGSSMCEVNGQVIVGGLI